MAEYRIGRSWTEAELEAHLAGLAGRGVNYSDPLEAMTPEKGWSHYFSEAVVGFESPGPPEPEGAFARGRTVVADYAFSDPRIVIGHYDPEVPLEGRRMLLEMRALRAFRYLSGTVVSAVRDETGGTKSVFGFRYDTLEGHIESGVEWFLLTKEHATGAIRFRIEAVWRPGQFPNWWSRLGFSFLGPYYQRRWHHRAHELMARLLHTPDPGVQAPEGGRLVDSTPEVAFRRTRPHRSRSLRPRSRHV